MNSKLILIVIISILLGVSIYQMLPLPPHNETMYPFYSSGYSDEVKKEYRVIARSFLSIKTMSRPDYAWIYLQDVKRSEGISVEVYDSQGRLIKAPGEEGRRNGMVASYLTDKDFTGHGFFIKNRFSYIIPMKVEKRCQFCHKKEELFIGALVFSSHVDGKLFYSFERILLFMIFSVILVALLFMVLRWDPISETNKLFDK